ncbi:MAG: hypothetical protein K9G59_12435 [Caulobacter sp.]|nr:hypothetical protein [Caulobacter sp.]
MRLSAIIPATVLIVSISASAFVLSRPVPPAEPEPATAMDLLRAYKCRRAETKQIIVRGVEDNYSPAGDEPNFIREGRQSADNLTFFAGGSYDQIQMDRRFTDSFRVPADTARGLFVIRMKAIGNNDNDSISIGDISTFSDAWLPRFGAGVIALERASGWTKRRDFYSAEFAAIIHRAAPRPPPDGVRSTTAGASLLDFVRNGGADGRIDVLVQDDTSVDMMGAAVCIEPPRGKGFSLSLFKGVPVPGADIVTISCSHGGRDQYSCDPYVGDTSCATPLPVACFRPSGAPMPKSLEQHYARQMWSGGNLAFTEPAPGAQFRTIGEVDRHCAGRFGPQWRAARLHDGMSGLGIAGFGDTRRLSSRAWVDIVDQPYATCWTRR